MKFLTLVIISILSLSSIKSVAGDYEKPLFSCYNYYYESGYSISIFINVNSATVLQASTHQAKIPPVYFTTVQSPFSVPNGKVLFQCSEKYDSGLKILIKVFGDKIQILDISSKGRRDPLEYTILNSKIIR